MVAVVTDFVHINHFFECFLGGLELTYISESIIALYHYVLLLLLCTSMSLSVDMSRLLSVL